MLALLVRVAKPVSPTMLVKLAFLVRHETNIPDRHSFYDFVPYLYGPFSFLLSRELFNLQRDGYLVASERSIGLADTTASLVEAEVARLPASTLEVVNRTVVRYAGVPQRQLLRDVYKRYPWYATRSQLTELLPQPLPRVSPARPAVYTVGYEGRSIDGFLDDLLQAGITTIVDVRSNPISRNYGYARTSLEGLSGKLGIGYVHIPELGIPSGRRRSLEGGTTRQVLFDRYEEHIRAVHTGEIERAARVVSSKASVLLCFESNPACCHRSRLASLLSSSTGLETIHL